MNIQQSYKETKYGKLYVVPTPIGNLEDITLRAMNTLKEVDLIAAEDTRHTQKLLNHFDIQNRLMSYHEHSKQSRQDFFMQALVDGKNIALVSDAGMPAISDPGYELVKAAIEKEIPVVVLPGANAALCALVGSGISTKEYLFYGFLPRKKQEKIAELERLSTMQASLIFYESPYRLKDTIQNLTKILGNRHIVIAREITKLHETFVRGRAEEVLEWMDNAQVKGECCIVVEGNLEERTQESNWWSDFSMKEHVNYYEEQQNMPHKLAMKQVAVDRNISRRDVYQAIHVKD